MCRRVRRMSVRLVLMRTNWIGPRCPRLSRAAKLCLYPPIQVPGIGSWSDVDAWDVVLARATPEQEFDILRALEAPLLESTPVGAWRLRHSRAVEVVMAHFAAVDAALQQHWHSIAVPRLERRVHVDVDLADARAGRRRERRERIAHLVAEMAVGADEQRQLNFRRCRA